MAEKGKANELTYDDFLDRLSIQEVLVDAGYHLNKRDGLRYPSYVRTQRGQTGTWRQVHRHAERKVLLPTAAAEGV